MSSKASQQFLLGLPASGKTTFLAALWHVLVEQDVPGSLKFACLKGDQTYLNRICKSWANVQEIERTKLGMGQPVSIQLRHPTLNCVTEVVIPDLSGESFEQQWTQRFAESDYAEIVANAEGGLLLVHPDLKEESLIASANSIVRGIDAHGSARADADCDSSEPWDPLETPTQVQLIELLQFLTVLNSRKSLRLAVIISAWDRVNDTDPGRWLDARAPMLSQFLRTNREIFDYRCYGLSAQGGDLDKSKEELQAVVSPSQRIRLVTAGSELTNDITMPLRWTMRWD